MHWPIVVNCVINPIEWNQIPLPLNKDLSIGTGFERALHYAGKELTKLAKSDKEVTFWIRGDVLLVTENGGLKPLAQGKHPVFELKAQIEALLEKCFRVTSETTGEYEWVECVPDRETEIGNCKIHT
jgi:hypothetical protein